MQAAGWLHASTRHRSLVPRPPESFGQTPMYTHKRVRAAASSQSLLSPEVELSYLWVMSQPSKASRMLTPHLVAFSCFLFAQRRNVTNDGQTGRNLITSCWPTNREQTLGKFQQGRLTAVIEG